MTGATPALSMVPAEGGILIGTPKTNLAIATLSLPLSSLGDEGYLIRSVSVEGKHATVIAANRDIGVLSGAFALLEHIERHQSIEKLDISSAPKLKLRLLNHWDNLNRSVERGYAGRSLWDWWELPEVKDPRYVDYARANASIGINGTVLNNVNAQADSLTAPYIAKAAVLAGIFRPYGIKVYLTPRFSSPIEIGGLKSADPLDPEVAQWWKAKVDEIYRAIPDFGGFLVKANAEGQPGPGDYHRTHAEGANMFAAALAPHGGVVMWRAFVYSDTQQDRAAQAYSEFTPLDGKFASNVAVQVKNGPIDFQPREPFHPLFGAMKKTPLMIEFEITKEYLGQATHLVYLGPLFEETLSSMTVQDDANSTVARILDGAATPQLLTGMAGVANVGTDRDWTGSIFNQANWFVFGRLAWDPEAKSRPIAQEWSELTFGADPRITGPVVDMMMGSREALVNYMMPLGLAHQHNNIANYGPGPWTKNPQSPETAAAYYNRADKTGIGFDRTATGSNAVAQYSPSVARYFGDLATVPDRNLLWFHHVGWDYRMRSGETLWASLISHYKLGVEQAEQMATTWSSLKGLVDTERFEKTSQLFEIQEREARWWRDASVLYFSTVSGQTVPADYPKPGMTLDQYEALKFKYVPGTPTP